MRSEDEHLIICAEDKITDLRCGPDEVYLSGPGLFGE